MPATPTDAYGLLLTAIRDDDPVVVFGPLACLGLREDVEYADLKPIPLGQARLHRTGTDVTVVAVGQLVGEAVAVADELAGEVSVEVFDPRSIFPFDWQGLAESLDKTGRLVVFDDGNRYAGLGAEVLATAAEEMRLIAPPRRITRPEAAMVGASPELDPGLLPNRGQLLDAIKRVLK